MPLEVSLLKNKYAIICLVWLVISFVAAFFCPREIPCVCVILSNSYYIAYLREKDENERERRRKMEREDVES